MSPRNFCLAGKWAELFPDVVEFGISPFSWRRHSCLLGRDSGLLISWNSAEPGGGARLQPAADFSPPAAGLTSLAGGRAEARRRLKSAPPSKRSPASGGPKWLTLFPRANRNCGRHQESRDSSRRSGTVDAAREEGRDESRPSRQECLRHENGLIPDSTTSGVLTLDRSISR
jgi:hypothetical protein